MVDDGVVDRPCSSRTYQSTPMPASDATSSRRSPGVRRRSRGSPSSSGRRRSRRARRKSPRALGLVVRVGVANTRMIPALDGSRSREESGSHESRSPGSSRISPPRDRPARADPRHRRGPRRRARRVRTLVLARHRQWRARLSSRAPGHAGRRRHRQGPGGGARLDESHRRRVGVLRPDRARARQWRRARHHVAGDHRADRRRDEVAPLPSPRFVGRGRPRPHRERHAAPA